MNSSSDIVLSLPSLLSDLHKAKLLDDDEYQRGQSIKRDSGDDALHIISVVAKHGLNRAGTDRLLTEYDIVDALARKHSLETYNIDPLEVDAGQVTDVMSYAFSERHNILAISASSDEITVACCEPSVRNWVPDLEHTTRRRVSCVLAAPSDIARYRVEFYQLANSVNRANFKQNTNSQLQNLESMFELGKAKAPEANDEHIINIVDWLLQYAFDQRASDIHVEPKREQTVVRFRIDGVLHSVYELPAQVGKAVVARIKSLGRMNIAEKRKPQDSRLKTKTPDGQEVELRLSTLPTAFGEKLVMRVFDTSVLVKSYAELGFSKADDQRWHAMTGQNHGIIFVTGPTGSGKTTTLYSTLKQLATEQVNVSTIEDPIEMVEPSFNQMQVQANIDLTFSSGIRALLRQDPDIIMVGEVRDLETAEIAVQAALTGHLVLSTLHTNDAPSAIVRLQELGLPSYLIRACVLGVMAQRLVRKLCPHCKTATQTDEASWKRLTSPWLIKMPEQVYKPVGCLECRNTGYQGRMGIYEVMPMSDTLEPHIGEQTDPSHLRKAAIKEGMHSLRLSGAQKVAQGLTCIEEVLRVAPLYKK